MAGHSHSKNVKLRKEAVDQKRGKLFSKMSRLIMMAARKGGGDPKTNPRLAFALAKAKTVSLPKDNVERAIKKGTGELESEKLEEVVYEGYGPGGVAVLCEIVTDNRNRTAGEIRKIFDLAGGKLGSTNCVAWMFQRKGQFLVAADGRSEEHLLEIIMNAGADDLRKSGDYFDILCDPTQFDVVGAALEAEGIEPDEADLVQIALNPVECDDRTARAIVKLLDALEEHDDVQNVYSNAQLPEAAYSG